MSNYHETSTDEQWAGFGSELQQYTSVPSSIVSDDRESLNIQEDFTDSEIEDEDLKKRRQKQDKVHSKHELHRKQRGKMNIKAVRHMKFLKDEVKVAGHRLKGRFSMTGKEPGSEFSPRTEWNLANEMQLKRKCKVRNVDWTGCGVGLEFFWEFRNKVISVHQCLSCVHVKQCSARRVCAGYP